MQLLSSLNKHKFSHEYLIQHFIYFACNGASNMIGRKAGVGKLLTDKYPDLLVWNCSNHRLELAVDDVVNEIAGINHFKIFFDTLYALYSSSPKNQYGFKSCAKEFAFKKNRKKLERAFKTLGLLYDALQNYQIFL